MSDSEALEGVQRAAVLLLSLGEQNAADILKLMGPKDVQKLGAAMATLKNVTPGQVDTAVASFLDSLGKHTALGVDSKGYVRNALVKALGKDKAGTLLDRILLGENAEGLETLKWMETRAVADMIRDEHPQIIAIVLAYMDNDQAAEILHYLPAEKRPNILMRIATLDTVQPTALQELNDTLETQVSTAGSMQTATVGGMKTAAGILNHLDSTLEAEIMEQVTQLDEEMGRTIQDLMFVFENLLSLDDAGTQTLLREVESETLLVALRGADEAMKEKIFGNMSKRAAQMLRDDLESKGPVRLSEVEAAQKQIIATAQRLSEEGQITLAGPGGDDFV